MLPYRGSYRGSLASQESVLLVGRDSFIDSDVHFGDTDAAKLPIVPQPPPRIFNAGRFQRKTRREGKCCAQRGCLCHAPEPYSLFNDPDEADEEEQYSSTISLPRVFSTGSKTSASDWRNVRHTAKWTRLQKKFTGNNTLPLAGKRMEQAELNRLAEGAVNSFVLRQSSDYIAVNVLESPTQDLTGSGSLGRSGSFLRKSVSFRRGQSLLLADSRASMLDGTGGMDPGIQAAIEKRMSRLSLKHGIDVQDIMSAAARKTSHFLPMSKTDEIIAENAIKPMAQNRLRRMLEKMRRQHAENPLWRKYQLLPEDERDGLEKAFIRFDADASFRLEWHEASSCLREFGLMGSTTKEKRDIFRICQEISLRAEVTEADLHLGKELIAKRLSENPTINALALAERRKVVNKAQNNVVNSLLVRNRDQKKIVSATRGSTMTTTALIMDVNTSSEASAGFKIALAAQASEESDDDKSVAFESSSEENSEYSFDFLSFAVQLVPKVRQRLTEMRRNRTLRYFGRFDKEGTGELDLDSCLEIGRCLGLDQLILTASLASRGVTRGGDKLANFSTLEKSIMRARETAERNGMHRELRILEDTGIDVEVFIDFRDIIGVVYEVFMQQPGEGEGVNRWILGASALVALRELGLAPLTLQDQQNIEKLLKGEEVEQKVEDNGDSSDDEEQKVPIAAKEVELTFEEFLNFTRKVRHFWRSNPQRQEDMWQKFKRLDVDQSGSLSIQELTVLLEEMGCLPRDRKEQDELSQVLTAVDVDGNGTLDFDEFQELVMRIGEKFAAVRHEAELEYSLAAGFRTADFHELKDAFSMLDGDGSGVLEESELRKCLTMLKKSYTNESFELAFTEFDDDESGGLDFMEFVNFMKAMRDEDGFFSDQSSNLPFRAKRLESRIIRMLLSHLNLSKSYLWSMNKQSLIELFYVSFDLTDDEPEGMGETLGVKTLEELLQLAKSKGEASLVHMQGSRGDD